MRGWFEEEVFWWEKCVLFREELSYWPVLSRAEDVIFYRKVQTQNSFK